MKLLVPYVGELEAVDAKLVRLAEFLGINCAPLALTQQVGEWAECLERAISNQPACLVVNPRVMQKFVGGDSLPPQLASFLVSHFSHLLVHAPRPAPFDRSMIAALSCGQLLSTERIESAGQAYEISPDCKDVCEAFAGLSFGPTNSANDRVFATSSRVSAVRTIVSVGGRPFMAALKGGKAEILFLAGQNVADLNGEVGDIPLVEYFSQLLPHAMALRYIFGEESWRPSEQHASIVVDDPLLRRNYGFLNFEFLLGLMKQHNFHTTIAFIPHNFQRSSPKIARMFRENIDRFAICFHGNDHTGAEFASTNTILLNTMLKLAEYRMGVHQKTTGVNCDRVMVFPQGNFSVEAMNVLKARNFESAVNTVPHPTHQPVRLTLGEIAQPAVLRYGGFPLFLRNDSVHTQSPDIAFNLFFGRPVLIVEHHDVFQRPQSLIEVASRINAAASEIQWSSLGSAVAGSTMRRRGPDALNIRAYSRSVRVSNDSSSTRRFLIEWRQPGLGLLVQQVLKDGTSWSDFESDEAGTRVGADLDPHSSHMFSVVFRNPYTALRSLGFRRNTRAYVRRRLSEVRDNYLSKKPSVLAAAKALQGRLRH